MKNWLIDKIELYAPFVIAGLIGAIVHRLRNTMSFKMFLAVLGISAFVGFCIGVLLQHYLEVTEEVIFVACSVSGVFAKDLLDEAQEIVKMISEFVRKKAKLDDKK
jgi:FtsH-binding integral membrane protein